MCTPLRRCGHLEFEVKDGGSKVREPENTEPHPLPQRVAVEAALAELQTTRKRKAPLTQVWRLVRRLPHPGEVRGKARST